MKTNNTIPYRVGILEDCYKSIDGKLDSLLQNHLPHIESKIASLETRINVLTALNIGAVILGVIISKIL